MAGSARGSLAVEGGSLASSSVILSSSNVLSQQAVEALRVLMGCSMILGMHPDQAAGPIVDVALALDKPFAIVPCCVFSSQFPRRRLSDGRPVRSYEELVRWLVERCPEGSIKVAQLPFEGRNVVVYRLPPSGAAMQHSDCM